MNDERPKHSRQHTDHTCRGCAGTGHVSPRYAFAGICTRCWGTGNEPAPKTENHLNGRSEHTNGRSER